MATILLNLASWLLASFVTRVLLGAGLTLVFSAALNIAIDPILSLLSSHIGSMTVTVIELGNLAGFGAALNITISAVLTRVLIINPVGKLTGIKKAT